MFVTFLWIGLVQSLRGMWIAMKKLEVPIFLDILIRSPWFAIPVVTIWIVMGWLSALILFVAGFVWNVLREYYYLTHTKKGQEYLKKCYRYKIIELPSLDNVVTQ